MIENYPESVIEYMKKVNHKIMLTPGPGALALENFLIAHPLFGRGDDEFTAIDERVTEGLKAMSGHDELVRLQGSASLALEIATRNFIYGKVLVVNTGFYCQRLIDYLNTIKETSDKINEIVVISVEDFISKSLDELLGEIIKEPETFDWLVSVYSETSNAFKNDIDKLAELKKIMGAYLFLDTTASIGLEDKHDRADLIAYSSCKGLFGITGACFVAYNRYLSLQKENSFYLNLETHKEKKMTGPYHPLNALDRILPVHHIIRERVVQSKKAFIERFSDKVLVEDKYQPLIATRVKGKLAYSQEHDGRPTVFYTPRVLTEGESVICHFGELHTSIENIGEIYRMIDIV